jgi:MSHA biogenesis protein MshL
MVFHCSIRKFFQLGLVCSALMGVSACESFDAALIDMGVMQDKKRYGGSEDMLIQPDQAKAAKPKAEPVVYMPLGLGVLMPDVVTTQNLPREDIGPYELRGESLAGALQFILSEFDIPLAVETDLAMNRKVTIANLNGRLDLMVEQLCVMSDLYCVYKNGVLSIQPRHDYAVSIPPSGATVDIIDDVARAIEDVTKSDVVVDRATRTLVYNSSRKQASTLARYFEKLRANMALINYEVGVWSVQLDPAHQQGVYWEALVDGSEGRASEIAGLYAGEYGAPVSLGLPGDVGDAYGMYDIAKFLSQFGSVKALSKPSISVMSGANGLWHVKGSDGAEGEKADQLTIGLSSLWDGASVFSDLNLEIDGDAERQIKTQMRIRPGDSLILAGMMRQRSDDARGEKEVTDELVVMLRPKVVVYRARKDYYGVNGIPRADNARTEQTDIWQSIGDEPMIIVPKAAPWPPLPMK